MEQDMHYYGLGFLARAAGIPKEQALTIAYASQYVDDSTESVAIRIGGGTFDTVRTAHLGPEAWTSGVHKDVYVPFHFLPEKPIQKLGDSYVTVPDSTFARTLLDRALEENDEQNRSIALGIALHTYADTFSHAGFTGRDDGENQLSNVARFENGKWHSADFSNLLGEFLKGVGHLLGGSYPDQPWLKWRCRHKGKQGYDVRDNKEIFLKAAKGIYDYLRASVLSTEKPRPWNEISPALEKVFATVDESLVLRIREWIELYGDTYRDNQGHRNIQGYRYQNSTWRAEAVEPVGNFTVEWDDLTREELERQKYKPKSGFYTSKWVRFHNMALKQRHFVRENLM